MGNSMRFNKGVLKINSNDHPELYQVVKSVAISSKETTNNSLENYMLKQIKRLEQEKVDLSATEKDYQIRMQRITGQIDILYQCLSGHDNKYEENQKLKSKI